MKRPPPDQAARVFTATERSQAALVAREDALRHPAPSALERAVDDMKEGTAIGASIIAHAASSSAFRVRARAAGVKRAVAFRLAAIGAAIAALARQSMRGVAIVVRAGAGALVSSGRFIWHTTGRIVTGVVLVLQAIGVGLAALARQSMRGVAIVVRAGAGALVSSGRFIWHTTGRIVTGVVLVLLAIGLGLAALVVGLVGAARTGIIRSAHFTAIGSRHLWKTTRVASQAGAAASVRAGIASAKVLARGGTAASHAVNHASAASRPFLLHLEGAARTGFVRLARATATGSHRLWKTTRVASQAGAAASVRAGVASAKVLARGGTAASHAVNHASAASRPFLLHLEGAARTGFVRLARATATGSHRLWKTTRVASQAGAAASVRAGVASAKVLARGSTASSHAANHASASSRAFVTRTAHDVARLRLTVRWHAQSARPIVGAVAGEFLRHLVQSVRQAQRRHVVAGFAVAAAVLIAAVYGAPSKYRSRVEPACGAIAGFCAKPAGAGLRGADARGGRGGAGRIVEGEVGRVAGASVAPPSTPRAAVPGAGADAEQATARRQSMVGTLLIASAPKGAHVTIDGIPRGVSPLSVSRLRAGNRIVRLELDGYQRWSWAVYVSASRQTRLNVSLVPDSGPSRSSAVTNTAAAAK